MKLEVVKMTLGPMANNVYLLADLVSKDAVIIDPTFDSDVILTSAEERGWVLQQIWLTHAHFDHIAGVESIARAFEPPLQIGLYPADKDWYQAEGGAGWFGASIPQPPPISIEFKDSMSLGFGQDQSPIVSVRHAPGHSPGHVMFYCESLGILFCGDVIFREGIGRTDLPGGDHQQLIRSIQEQVFTLPDDTRLLPGHGPESSVGYEKEHNPFLQGV